MSSAINDDNDRMSLTLESAIKLSSGYSIPLLGLGVYQSRGEECQNAVEEAIKVGYKHIDSAQAYHNEDLVGQAVVASGVARSSLFLTTKYMATHQVHPSENVLAYLKKSITKIDQKPGPDGAYIDLMLIHAPFGGDEGRKNNWQALVDAQKEGWIRDIGVSNFGVKHLKSLPGPKPAINQIELHPWCQQKDIVKYCEEHGIIVEAYTPIVRGKEDRLGDPVVVGISKKHGKEAVQVLLRWSLQKGFVPLPKSVTPSRIASNADLYDFELDKEDMAALDGLDRGADGAVTWNPVNQD